MRTTLIVTFFVFAAFGLAVPERAYSNPSACEPFAPEDALTALNFVDDLFTDDAWVLSFTGSSDWINISWQLGDPESVGFLEYLVFTCGYDRETIFETYFNEGYFDFSLRTYESYEITLQCSSNDVTLYEMALVFEGRSFVMHRWVVLHTDTRIITFSLIFPPDRSDLLYEYSTEQFPEIPFCRALARPLQ
ncbi:MAG: hypothetical protein AAGK74_09040 [Chloroflexota bacterium]